MAKKPQKPGKSDQDDDWALWQSVAGQVDPLPGKSLKKPSAPEKESPKKSNKKPMSAMPVQPRHVTSDLRAAPSVLPELSAGAFAGLDKRTAQRLKRGQLKIEARLDLHHMTQAEAQLALNHFVTDSVTDARRTVIVITGKGLKRTGEVGVLRTMVPHWLNQAPLRAHIVAFCEAAPKDGGSGALYLRLKKFS